MEFCFKTSQEDVFVALFFEIFFHIINNFSPNKTLSYLKGNFLFSFKAKKSDFEQFYFCLYLHYCVSSHEVKTWGIVLKVTRKCDKISTHSLAIYKVSAFFWIEDIFFYSVQCHPVLRQFTLILCNWITNQVMCNVLFKNVFKYMY